MKTLSCGLLLFALGGGLASATENGVANATPPATQGAATDSQATCPAGQNAGDRACTASMPAPPYTEKLRSDADAVLKGPDFHSMESMTVPVARPWLKKWLQREKTEEKKPADRPDFSGLAQLLKILLLVIMAVLLGWLLWRGYQWLTPQLQQNRKQQKGHIHAARSLPLQDPAQLPDGISNSAARAWQAGHATEALSLLYRGALATLANHYQLSLPGGATEGDYQRLLRRSGKRELQQGFNIIVQAWMAQAYADQRPDDFPRLLQTYRQHFEASGSPT